MIKTIKASNVLKRTLEADKARIILHQGGSRSSKTFSIFQSRIIKAFKQHDYKLTIGRQTLADAKLTLLPTFKEVLASMGVSCTPSINPRRQEQIYQIDGTNATFTFIGVEDEAKLSGMEQDDFWLNEVMEVSKAAFDQAEMRTKDQMIIDFNPSDDEHWVFNLERRNDVVKIESTRLDNPFLPKAIINKIKGYEPTPENDAQGTSDSYMWSVYGLGKPAKLKGAIFTRWEVIKEIPDEARHAGYGLDFGYSNDPAALISMYKWNNSIVVDLLTYETKLLNVDISREMEFHGIGDNDLVVADCAEPKSIEEIRVSGFYGIRESKKGRDSIKYGIDLLQSTKIYVTERSSGLIQELKKYKWRETKDGRTLNDPIDDYNHAIDAMRYLAMEVLKKQSESKSVLLSPEFEGGKYWLQPSMPTPDDIINEHIEYLGSIDASEED